MNVYFISGLAADGRVFQFIDLPEGYYKINITWITPKKEESLKEYALRLTDQINHKEPFVLVGLSMGGMLASEIAKIYPPLLTILISSVPASSHLPAYYKYVNRFKLYRLVPTSLLKSISVAKRIFSTETHQAKKVLVEVIRDSDPVFIRWAVQAILEWRNETIPHPMKHIHGTKDGILPIKNTTASHTIPDGTHLMLMSRVKELNQFFKEVLEEVESRQL